MLCIGDSKAKIASALAAFAALGAACAGPAAEPAAGPPNYQNYEKMDAEFQKAKQDLQLPTGVTWPARANDVPETIYEKNYGVTEAQLFWLCAWEKDLVAASSRDPARYEAALRQLDHLENTWLYQHGVEPSLRQLLADSIERAEQGDVSLIQQDVKVNCVSQ